MSTKLESQHIFDNFMLVWAFWGLLVSLSQNYAEK
jgi:hypothetical protein